ncbi:aspartic proteinase cdr1 [Phtheirospermum japonicum]|uniref:Aspartic proteinase cdr1 n=1 Tax=Phtheirospermum japonicum TaxID=374723 RepID=A0A830CQH0_9LAMI|nr:aspartic proteinase cdr1 [Phtheirospermum japonicum]
MALFYKSLSFSLYSIIAYVFASVYLLSWIEATKYGGITIDLIHRDSPLSPFYNPSTTRFERLKNAFERSVSPQKDLEAPIIPSRDPTTSGGDYLMKIGIGTPPVEILGIADTGSDLTWTQCQPCTRCYKQKAPLFDPRKTSTYRTISCQSQTCSQLRYSSCDSKNVCAYQYAYGDASSTKGDLSVETLTFDSSVSFPKFLFGCGHANVGSFSESESGIIGLGGGPLSIITQLNQSIGGKFSYCLTLPDSNATSKISFGTNAIVTGPNVVSTPLVKKQPDTYYYLTLEGVSVGTKRVNHVSDAKAPVKEGNIIIDSGTALTFLPSSFYKGLESALVAAVKGNRVSDSKGTYKLCYKKSSDFSAPPVTAHFKGADVELTQETTFSEVQEGVVCLTLLPIDGLGYFGNLHQINYEVGYDIAGQKVNFLKKDCSKSQRTKS